MAMAPPNATAVSDVRRGNFPTLSAARNPSTRKHRQSKGLVARAIHTVACGAQNAMAKNVAVDTTSRPAIGRFAGDATSSTVDAARSASPATNDRTYLPEERY